MPAQFRWLLVEEKWLEDRVIADEGRSKPTDQAWTSTVAADFQACFPRAPRLKLDGKPESCDELDLRWREVPKVGFFLFPNLYSSLLVLMCAPSCFIASEEVAAQSSAEDIE